MRRRWNDGDWFDWQEDGPKLIKRIALGALSAMFMLSGCSVFVSSALGGLGSLGGENEGFISDFSTESAWEEEEYPETSADDWYSSWEDSSNDWDSSWEEDSSVDEWQPPEEPEEEPPME